MKTKNKKQTPGTAGTETVETAIVPVDVRSAIETVPSLPKDRNPYFVYLGRFSSKNSRETMAYALRSVAGVLAGAEPYEDGGGDIHDVDASTVAWWNLRYQHVERIKATLVAHHAAPTVNKILSALRQVLDTSRKLELMTADQCSAAMDVKSMKFSLLPAGRRAQAEEIERLLASMPANGLRELRDRALVTTLYYAGVRRSEVAWLTMDRVSMGERNLRVLGKGNKERDVPIVDALLAALGAWVDARGPAPGALFCAMGGEGLIATQAMSPQSVYDLVVDAAETCGLAHLSPHDLRRSFITNGIEAGIDPLSMSKIVGHEQLQTTIRYDRREENVRRKQMNAAFNKPMKETRK